MGIVQRQNSRLQLRQSWFRIQVAQPQNLSIPLRIFNFYGRRNSPDIADRAAIVANLAPGPEIGASPGFAHDLHAGIFDSMLFSWFAPLRSGPHDIGRGRSWITHRSSPETVNCANFAEWSATLL